MDDFAIKLALEQGGQAESAAASATDVEFAPPGSAAPLGKLDPNQKIFPFGGLVLGAASVGFLLWLIRR
jgi:hypothetical protein